MDYIVYRCINRECTLKDVCYRYLEGEPTDGMAVETFTFEPIKKACAKFIVDPQKSIKNDSYRA